MIVLGDYFLSKESDIFAKAKFWLDQFWTGVKMLCSSQLVLLYLPYCYLRAFVLVYLMNKVVWPVHQKRAGSVLMHGATDN